MYGSCEKDSDCDASVGESCVIRDGEEGVCALPLRECDVGAKRACANGCSTVEESCLETGRWSGCLSEAVLTCPTGYLLTSMDGSRVEASASGSRGMWKCVSCTAEDTESDVYRVQCCGGADGASVDWSNIYCCDLLSGTEREACLRSHILPVHVSPVEPSAEFCFAGSNEHFGRDVEVYVPRESIEFCVKALKEGELTASTSFGLTENVEGKRREIGLWSYGKCDTSELGMGIGSNLVTNVDLVYAGKKGDAAREITCRGLLEPVAYSILAKGGARVECDELTSCDIQDDGMMRARRARISIEGDHLECAASAGSLTSVRSCAEMLVSLEAGTPSLETLFTTYSSCYSAVGVQESNIYQHCPMRISQVGEYSGRACFSAFKRYAEDYITSCAAHDLTCASSAGVTTNSIIDHSGRETGASEVREEVVSLIEMCGRDLEWADEAFVERNAQCDRVKCDVLERSGADGHTLYSSESCNGAWLCGSGAVECVSGESEYLGEYPTCEGGEAAHRQVGVVSIDAIKRAMPDGIENFSIESFDAAVLKRDREETYYLLALSVLLEGVQDSSFEEGGVILLVVTDEGEVKWEKRLSHKLAPYLEESVSDGGVSWVGVKASSGETRTKSVTDIYVQRVMLNEALNFEGEASEVASIYGVFSGDGNPVCDLSKFRDRLSEEVYSSACEAVQDRQWSDKIPGGCSGVIAKLCDDITWGEVTGFEIQGDHQPIISVTREAGETRYVESVDLSTGEVRAKAPGMGEYGVWTEKKACYLEEGTMSVLRDGRIRKIGGDAWVFGYLTTRSLKGAVEESGGGEEGRGDSEPSEAPSAESVSKRVILGKLAKWGVSTCWGEVSEGVPTHVQPLIEFGLETSGERYLEGIKGYVSDIRFLENEVGGSACGTWMGMWPYLSVSGNGKKITGFKLGRAEICLGYGVDGEAQYRWSGAKSIIEITEAGGVELSEISSIERMDLEVISEALCLVHLNVTMNDGSREILLGTIRAAESGGGFRSLLGRESGLVEAESSHSVYLKTDGVFSMSGESGIKINQFFCKK